MPVWGWKANPSPLREYARAPLCNVNSQYLTPEIDGACAPPDGTVTIPGCGDESPVEPLWRRERDDEECAGDRARHWPRVRHSFPPNSVALPASTVHADPDQCSLRTAFIE